MTTSRVVEKRPPLEVYIDKLLYSDLSKKTIETNFRQFRKLNWNDPYTRNYAVKALSAGWRMKYSVIHCAASIVSGLSKEKGLK